MRADARKLLVVGASGLVGAELARRARARGRAVVGAARTTAGEASLALDLADRARIDEVLTTSSPDEIAICSAWPYVDGCEKDPQRSFSENVATVQNLIDATAGARTRLIFFSTDHVFDGRQPRNFEDDPVHPLSVYARHKREVEERLLARGGALIVRTAWVFGVEARRKNFVYQVIEASRAGRGLSLPRAQAGCPTWSGWLADATLDLAEDGIAHLTGDEPLTKAEWAGLILDALGLPKIPVREVPWSDAGQLAPRPERVVLATRRTRRPQPPLQEVLASLRPQLLAKET